MIALPMTRSMSISRKRFYESDDDDQQEDYYDDVQMLRLGGCSEEDEVRIIGVKKLCKSNSLESLSSIIGPLNPSTQQQQLPLPSPQRTALNNCSSEILYTSDHSTISSVATTPSSPVPADAIVDATATPSSPVYVTVAATAAGCAITSPSSPVPADDVGGATTNPNLPSLQSLIEHLRSSMQHQEQYPSPLMQSQTQFPSPQRTGLNSCSSEIQYIGDYSPISPVPADDDATTTPSLPSFQILINFIKSSIQRQEQLQPPSPQQNGLNNCSSEIQYICDYSSISSVATTPSSPVYADAVEGGAIATPSSPTGADNGVASTTSSLPSLESLIKHLRLSTQEQSQATHAEYSSISSVITVPSSSVSPGVSAPISPVTGNINVSPFLLPPRPLQPLLQCTTDNDFLVQPKDMSTDEGIFLTTETRNLATMITRPETREFGTQTSYEPYCSDRAHKEMMQHHARCKTKRVVKCRHNSPMHFL